MMEDGAFTKPARPLFATEAEWRGNAICDVSYALSLRLGSPDEGYQGFYTVTFTVRELPDGKDLFLDF